MKTVYNYYTDPGHGWLKVTIDELKELNILDQISSYSYTRKNNVYLEEDCDMGIFMKAKPNAIKLKEHYSNKSSKIRSYNRVN